MKSNTNQINYIKNYNKNNYIEKKLYFRKEDKDKIDKILNNKNETLKSYLMKNIEKDLKNS